MLAINSTRDLSLSVGKFYLPLNQSTEDTTVFSLPYIDSADGGKFCTDWLNRMKHRISLSLQPVSRVNLNCLLSWTLIILWLKPVMVCLIKNSQPIGDFPMDELSAALQQEFLVA